MFDKQICILDEYYIYMVWQCKSSGQIAIISKIEYYNAMYNS